MGIEIKNTYKTITIHKPGCLYEFSNHKNQVRYGKVISASIEANEYQTSIIYCVQDSESLEYVNVDHDLNRTLK